MKFDRQKKNIVAAGLFLAVILFICLFMGRKVFGPVELFIDLPVSRNQVMRDPMHWPQADPRYDKIQIALEDCYNQLGEEYQSIPFLVKIKALFWFQGEELERLSLKMDFSIKSSGTYRQCIRRILEDYLRKIWINPNEGPHHFEAEYCLLRKKEGDRFLYYFISELNMIR